MTTQTYDQWLEMSRAAMAPITRWQELASKTAEKVAEQSLLIAQDYVELGARQLQLMGEVKDPQKWAMEESKLVAEFGQKMVGRAGAYLKAARETRDEFTGWAETTAKAAGVTPSVLQGVYPGKAAT